MRTSVRAITEQLGNLDLRPIATRLDQLVETVHATDEASRSVPRLMRMVGAATLTIPSTAPWRMAPGARQSNERDRAMRAIAAVPMR